MWHRPKFLLSSDLLSSFNLLSVLTAYVSASRYHGIILIMMNSRYTKVIIITNKHGNMSETYLLATACQQLAWRSCKSARLPSSMSGAKLSCLSGSCHCKTCRSAHIVLCKLSVWLFFSFWLFCFCSVCHCCPHWRRLRHLLMVDMLPVKALALLLLFLSTKPNV